LAKPRWQTATGKERRTQKNEREVPNMTEARESCHIPKLQAQFAEGKIDRREFRHGSLCLRRESDRPKLRGFGSGRGHPEGRHLAHFHARA
jgi:hypothetical protein